MSVLASPVTPPAIDPLISRAVGPVTRRKILRAVALYGVLFAFGLIPTLAGMGSRLQVFGQGLWLPGGGFVADGGPSILLFPATLLIFALSIFAWFGTGMTTLPVLVWLGAAGLAASIAPPTIAHHGPWINGAIVLAFIGWRVRGYTKKAATDRKTFNARSENLPALVASARDVAIEAPVRSDREHSTEQLAALRYVLDRALQDIEAWDGFDVIDEFQSASRRYQLHQLCYALSLAQTHYTPSFHGYLSQAQRNLIDKHRRPEVWRYWVYESIGGHLNFRNFDPAGKDNIMLTAFFSKMACLYMSATGDRRYEQPGSLSFRLSDRTTYEHDVHSIVASLVRNFDSSPFCLYPCEPNWVFPICNHYGISSLRLYDRLFGTQLFDEIMPRWLHGLDTEFTDLSGSVIGVRSNYTGFQFKFPSGDLGLSVITNGFRPSRAARMWAVARGDLQRALMTGDDGRPYLRVDGPGFDAGHYRKGHGRTMAVFANIAREFGDEALAEAAFNTLDKVGGRRDDGGVLRFTSVSNLGNASVVQAKLARRNYWQDAVAKGPPEHIFHAPILAEADYPAVQVARAYSNGDDLDLVLHPGGGSREQIIGFERLQAGRSYSVLGGPGGTLTADAQGRASIAIVLNGRTPLRLQPVGR